MASILYLVHRVPYPPDKGDKVRSYHLLRHLARRHRVYLGTFADDPSDMAHAETLRTWCADVHIEPLDPSRARFRSLAGLLSGQPLTLHYYRSRALRSWVAKTVADQHLDAAVVFSSSMAQYAQQHPGLPMLVDLVDVDSEKWSEYAQRHRWPMSWVYRREGRALLACERQVVNQAQQSFLATEKETALFARLAPESAVRVQAMNNGVDTAYFCPDEAHASPFAADEQPLVFTGAMDYWPNIDAVVWFAQDVLPLLRQRWPRLRFHIVGRSPTPEVLALAQRHPESVTVSGTVPDVRPYLQHAAVVVAPLRLARGIQNKILEAMAMARPVVTTQACAEALMAQPGRDLRVAVDGQAFVDVISDLLNDPQRTALMGLAARQCVQGQYSWDAHLRVLENLIPGSATRPVPFQGLAHNQPSTT